MLLKKSTRIFSWITIIILSGSTCNPAGWAIRHAEGTEESKAKITIGFKINPPFPIEFLPPSQIIAMVFHTNSTRLDPNTTEDSKTERTDK